MNGRRLRSELRRTRPPQAGAAQARARVVALAAYAERPPPAPRRWLGAALPVALLLLLAIVAGAVAATPPVKDWVRDLVGRASPAPRPAPALSRVPGGGRLLVAGTGGAWVVHADGSRRRLGGYRQATWSPRGLFIAATRGRQLVALEPGGRVRWALARSRAIRDPRWASSGFRVTYRSGSQLRVVAGDGSGDRLLAARVRPVAAAWRPAGTRNELAYVSSGGRVIVADTDRGRVVARLRTGHDVRALQWSSSGERLLASGPRGAWVLSRSGAVRVALPAPAGTVLTDAALSPDGRRVALVRRTLAAGRHQVLMTSASAAAPRSLFTADGPIRSVTWAPDGRLVLADWAGADQWLFLPVRRGARAAAVAQIAAQFGVSHPRSRGGVRVEGWAD